MSLLLCACLFFWNPWTELKEIVFYDLVADRVISDPEILFIPSHFLQTSFRRSNLACKTAWCAVVLWCLPICSLFLMTATLLLVKDGACFNALRRKALLFMERPFLLYRRKRSVVVVNVFLNYLEIVVSFPVRIIFEFQCFSCIHFWLFFHEFCAMIYLFAFVQGDSANSWFCSVKKVSISPKSQLLKFCYSFLSSFPSAPRPQTALMERQKSSSVARVVALL